MLKHKDKALLKDSKETAIMRPPDAAVRRAEARAPGESPVIHGCDSDGELSVASPYGSEVQDCRKRPRQPQIIGSSWVLHGQITMDQLHADSDPMAAGPEGDVENEDRISKINTRLQGLFGTKLEILFGKLLGNVMYFVIFCNLINILDVGADSSDAVKIKIEIRGFLQLRKATTVTALQKLLSPFAPALSGCWERCVGGLFGHAGYTECPACARKARRRGSNSTALANSVWFKLHHTGEHELACARGRGRVARARRAGWRAGGSAGGQASEREGCSPCCAPVVQPRPAVLTVARASGLAHWQGDMQRNHNSLSNHRKAKNSKNYLP